MWIVIISTYRIVEVINSAWLAVLQGIDIILEFILIIMTWIRVMVFGYHYLVIPPL